MVAKGNFPHGEKPHHKKTSISFNSKAVKPQTKSKNKVGSIKSSSSATRSHKGGNPRRRTSMLPPKRSTAKR